MPAWLVSILMQLLSKYLTPDVIKELEDRAKEFACCELKKFVAQTPGHLDDDILAKVAAALGVDLSKCPV